MRYVKIDGTVYHPSQRSRTPEGARLVDRFEWLGWDVKMLHDADSDTTYLECVNPANGVLVIYVQDQTRRSGRIPPERTYWIRAVVCEACGAEAAYPEIGLCAACVAAEQVRQSEPVEIPREVAAEAALALAEKVLDLAPDYLVRIAPGRNQRGTYRVVVTNRPLTQEESADLIQRLGGTSLRFMGRSSADGRHLVYDLR